MMKTIKKILILTLSIAAVFCFSSAISVTTTGFAASETVASESDFSVLGGAVKVKDSRGAGVKFHVAMTENYFKTYGTINSDGSGTLKSGVKTGTLLLPYRLTNGNDLVVSGTGYGATVSDSDTSGVWEKVTLGGTTYMQSVVYLYNIPSTDYGTEVSVRGYVYDGTFYVYTAQENGISMSFVANAELNDGSSELTADEKANLKTTYLNKTVKYHVEGAVTEETVDYLGTVVDCPTIGDTLADGSKFYGWTLRDGTKVVNVDSTRVKNPKDLYAVYRKKIVMSGSSFALSLANYDYDSVVSIKLGNYDLGTNPAALNVSDALKADTKNHGEKEVVVTLTKSGKNFKITLPVLLVTKEINSLEDFLSSCRYYGTDIYGYYVLNNDISYTEGFGSYATKAECSYRGDKKGFKGVFDGQGHKITWKYNNIRGIFGTLYEATVKNLALHNDWYSPEWGAAAFAYTAYYSTFENVDISFVCNPQTATNYAPVIQEMAGCKWKNCTISSNNSVGILIGQAKKDNIDSTYENVTVTAVSTKFGNDVDSFDSIQQVQPETATLETRQDFVLDGKWDILDLGIYNGLEILGVTAGDGTALSGISPASAKKVLTDKSKHGEQNFTVTVLKADGTKAVITVPVTVITKEISSMSELQKATKAVDASTNKYGYYVLTNDVSHTETGFTLVNAKGNFADGAAFRGTLDGNGYCITTKSTNTSGGLFGAINGATIKNLTITDEKTASWGYAPAVARNAYNTTFENVTIKLLDGSAANGTTDNTPIIGRDMKNCVWKDSNIISAVNMVNVFAELTNNTFENVNIDANVTGGFSVTTAAYPDGVTCGEKAILVNTYDFALNAENKLTLGEGYEDITITKIECNGTDVTTDQSSMTDKLGTNVTLTVTGTRNSKNVVLTVPAFVVTDTISTMKQFESAVRYYKNGDKNGYFVLTKDISTYESDFAWDNNAYAVDWSVASTGGFIGTFDGRGYTITLLSSEDNFNGGLFGIMNGTFKNTVINAKNAVSYSKSIIARICSGVVENVTVNIFDGGNSTYPYENGDVGALVETALYGGSWKNVTVNADMKVNFLFPVTANNNATFENCTLNAPDYNNFNKDAKTLAGWTFKCTTSTTELTDTTERLINLNIADGNVNETDTYTLDVAGLTETNFVSVSYNGRSLNTDGLTLNVSEFGKTYGKGELEIKYLYKAEKRTHILPVTLATDVINSAEELRFF